jgi:hypothetical protein
MKAPGFKNRSIFAKARNTKISYFRKPRIVTPLHVNKPNQIQCDREEAKVSFGCVLVIYRDFLNARERYSTAPKELEHASRGITKARWKFSDRSPRF